MDYFEHILIILIFAIIGFYAIVNKILRMSFAKSLRPASNLPYYGSVLIAWLIIANLLGLTVIHFIPYFMMKPIFAKASLDFMSIIILNIVLILVGCWLIKPGFKAREHFELIGKFVLVLSSLLTLSVTIIIVISVLFESIKFFGFIPVTDFLFGLTWKPEATAIDGVYYGYGFIPVLTGTLLITFIAMIVAAPLGLFSAIFISEYCSSSFRNWIKPLLEMLSGIPTVIYGYFAAISVGPFIRSFANYFGLNASSENALGAGLVMGIMIIPFVMSLSDNAFKAVPKNLRDAGFALGSTKQEVVTKIVLPAALPGVMGAFLLAISRAIGETMIVTMAAGLTAKLSANPLDSVTTVTAQIMNLLLGDQEFDHPKTLAAFALGLILFIMTLILNVIALMIVKKYREKYE